MKRPSWDQYFMGLADQAAKRATCDRGKSGAVVVKDKNVLATGYVGSASGDDHCDDVGHMMQEVIDELGNKSMHCVRTIHAEENAILQAAKIGTSLEGGTLYCKMTPCYRCARMISRVGIKRVVAKKRYHADKLSVKLFKKAKIKLDVFENKVEKYKNQ